MNAIVVMMSYKVLARTRDECIVKMDEMGLELLEVTGGAPWVATDDDIIKHRADAPMTLADDQGFIYEGTRNYMFGGPFLADVSTRQHEFFRVQKGIDDE